MTRTAPQRVGGLATYAWLPPDPWAVLVARTPYGAAAHAAEGSAWAARGVGFVAQDVRGRQESPGEFVPYTEATHDDGPRLLAWVRKRTDAPVVLHGTSYGAHAALATACAPGVEPPAGVVAMVPALGLGETARTRGGILQLASRLGWWLAHDVRRPWSDVVEARRTDAERATAVARLRCPLLAIGGTDDFFAHDTLDLAAAWGGPARLVMGPWDHSLVGARRADRALAWLADLVVDRPPVGVETVDRDGVVGQTRPPRAVVHLDAAPDEQWCATLLAGERPIAYGAAYGHRIELGPVVLAAAERADLRVRLSVDDFPHYARSLRPDLPVPDHRLELHP